MSSKRITIMVAVWVATIAWGSLVLAAEDKQPKPREAYLAGRWYPARASELAQLVDQYLQKSAPPKLEGKPVALIAPHAGYRYSAPTAEMSSNSVGAMRRSRSRIGPPSSWNTPSVSPRDRSS